jgi:serine phosphatase RsbU (regulator of sigma subunit)/tetratricopeptide (TPR) repeat protein/anti-sigma regulatory factor (Ser/Thr protein kinase)
VFKVAQKEELRVPAEVERLGDLRDFVVSIGKRYHLADKMVNAFKLAVDEAATNIIKYAYENSQSSITIRAIVKKDSVTMILIDQGTYFDPSWSQDPDIRQAADGGDKAGLGIFMMRRLMDRIDYEKTDAGNELHLTKFRRDARTVEIKAKKRLADVPPFRDKYFIYAVLSLTLIISAIYGFTYFEIDKEITADFIDSGKQETEKLLEKLDTDLLLESETVANSHIRSIAGMVMADRLGQIYSIAIEDTLGRIAWSSLGAEIDTKYQVPDSFEVLEPGLVSYLTPDSTEVLEFERSLDSAESLAYAKLRVLLSLDYAKRQIELRRWYYLKVAMIVLVLGYIVSGLLSYLITDPMRKLSSWVKAVHQGELGNDVNIDTSSEFGEIAQAFTDLNAKFRESQKSLAHQETFKKEIELAKDIQQALLPNKLPTISHYEIAACYEAAKSVGGDYYDFFEVDKDTLGVVVADVSGKGVPGSLVMTMIRTALRTEARGSYDSAEVLTRVNDFIINDIKHGMFVTVLYLIIDTKRHEVNFASAGHTPMILHRRATEQTFYLNPLGFPIGIRLPDNNLFGEYIQAETIQLKPEDILLLYTDGITEAMNARRELFGEERLLDFIRANCSLGINKFRDKLKTRIKSFTEGYPQSDDITFLAIRGQQQEGVEWPEPEEFLAVERKFLNIHEVTRLLDVVRRLPHLEPHEITEELNAGLDETYWIPIDKIDAELLRRKLDTILLRQEYSDICRARRRNKNLPGQPDVKLARDKREGPPPKLRPTAETDTSSVVAPDFLLPETEADYIVGDFLLDGLDNPLDESLVDEDADEFVTGEFVSLALQDEISDSLIDTLLESHLGHDSPGDEPDADSQESGRNLDQADGIPEAEAEQESSDRPNERIAIEARKGLSHEDADEAAWVLEAGNEEKEQNRDDSESEVISADIHEKTDQPQDVELPDPPGKSTGLAESADEEDSQTDADVIRIPVEYAPNSVDVEDEEDEEQTGDEIPAEKESTPSSNESENQEDTDLVAEADDRVAEDEQVEVVEEEDVEVTASGLEESPEETKHHPDRSEVTAEEETEEESSEDGLEVEAIEEQPDTAGESLPGVEQIDEAEAAIDAKAGFDEGDEIQIVDAVSDAPHAGEEETLESISEVHIADEQTSGEDTADGAIAEGIEEESDDETGLTTTAAGEKNITAEAASENPEFVEDVENFEDIEIIDESMADVEDPELPTSVEPAPEEIVEAEVATSLSQLDDISSPLVPEDALSDTSIDESKIEVEASDEEIFVPAEEGVSTAEEEDRDSSDSPEIESTESTLEEVENVKAVEDFDDIEGIDAGIVAGATGPAASAEAEPDEIVEANVEPTPESLPTLDAIAALEDEELLWDTDVDEPAVNGRTITEKIDIPAEEAINTPEKIDVNSTAPEMESISSTFEEIEEIEDFEDFDEVEGFDEALESTLSEHSNFEEMTWDIPAAEDDSTAEDDLDEVFEPTTELTPEPGELSEETEESFLDKRINGLIQPEHELPEQETTIIDLQLCEFDFTHIFFDSTALHEVRLDHEIEAEPDIVDQDEIENEAEDVDHVNDHLAEYSINSYISSDFEEDDDFDDVTTTTEFPPLSLEELESIGHEDEASITPTETDTPSEDILDEFLAKITTKGMEPEGATSIHLEEETESEIWAEPETESELQGSEAYEPAPEPESSEWTPENITKEISEPGALPSEEAPPEAEPSHYLPEFEIALLQGVTHYKKREYVQAIKEFKRVLMLEPDYKDGYQLLGNAYFRHGMLKDALAAYERHRFRHPSDAMVRENLGLIYAKLGVLPLAIKEWQALLDTNPGRRDIARKIERLETYLEDSKKVEPPASETDAVPETAQNANVNVKPEEEFVEEPEIDPIEEDLNNYKNELLQVGIKHYRRQEYDRAIEAFEFAIKSFPELQQAYPMLANTYYRTQRFEDAARIYKKMTKMDFDRTAIHENMGMIYAHQGDYKKALDEWKRALKFNPNRRDIQKRVEKVSEML